MRKFLTLFAAIAIAVAMQAENTLELVCTNMKTQQDATEGKLFLTGLADDMTWGLDLVITGYTSYGTYNTISGGYFDITGKELTVAGSGTFSYDNDLKSDKLVATLTTEDKTLTLNVTMYYAEVEDTRIPVVIVVADAKFTVDKNDYLWIEGIWKDTTANHTLKFELAEGLQYDKEYTEVCMLMDQNTDDFVFAIGKPILTKEGNIATLKGRFESNFDGTLYDVTVTGVAPEQGAAVENIVVDKISCKQIVNGQLVIINNVLKYNSLGAVIE